MEESLKIDGKIYLIKCQLNDKVYIGQTVSSIKRRWNAHCLGKDISMPIARALKKYGKDNFTIEMIDKSDNLLDLNKKEEFWIQKYNSTDRSVGYNVQFGGLNKTMSQDTKNKISKAKIGNKVWESADYRKKMIEKRKEVGQSTEFKQKMSKVNSQNAKNRYSKEFKVYEAILDKIENRSKTWKKGKEIGSWNHKDICAKDLDIYWTGISQCLCGTIKQYKNYIFEYTGK